MAHPSRVGQVDELRARLDRAPTVVWDDGSNNVWITGRRSLLASLEQPGSHSFILQDDAVIPDRLVEVCESILGHTPPDVPVALYMGRSRTKPRRFAMSAVTDEAKSAGASFAVFGGPYWGVGLLIPQHDIEAIVAHGDENTHRERNYDIRIARFYESKGIDCWYTMPSVVDHRRGPSLMGRAATRHAQWHEPGPLSEHHWAGAVIHPEVPGLG